MDLKIAGRIVWRWEVKGKQEDYEEVIMVIRDDVVFRGGIMIVKQEQRIVLLREEDRGRVVLVNISCLGQRVSLDCSGCSCFLGIMRLWVLIIEVMFILKIEVVLVEESWKEKGKYMGVRFFCEWQVGYFEVL